MCMHDEYKLFYGDNSGVEKHASVPFPTPCLLKGGMGG